MIITLTESLLERLTATDGRVLWDRLLCGFAVRANKRRRTFLIATSVKGRQVRMMLAAQGLRSSNKKTFSACDGKSGSSQSTGTLDGCRSIFHSGRASGETDTATRSCARPPSAACPDRSHAADAAMRCRSGYRALPALADAAASHRLGHRKCARGDSAARPVDRGPAGLRRPTARSRPINHRTAAAWPSRPPERDREPANRG